MCQKPEEPNGWSKTKEFSNDMSAKKLKKFNMWLRGCAKKKNSKNPRLLWKWVGVGQVSLKFFFF